MKRSKRFLLYCFLSAFCLHLILPLCGCAWIDPYGFIKEGTTWVSEEGDISFTCINSCTALGTVVMTDGTKNDFYMVHGPRSATWELADINTYYARPTDASVMFTFFYDEWVLKRTGNDWFSAEARQGSDGIRYTEVGRIITFRRDDSAPPFDMGGREWLAFGERPVDLFDTVWRESSGNTLRIGHAPLVFGSDGTNEYLVRIRETKPYSNEEIYYLYPVASAALIGTDEFEATCLGYWKRYSTQTVDAVGDLQCLGVVNSNMERARTSLFYDASKLINLSIGNSLTELGKYPGMKMQARETMYCLSVGDPATMTGTMMIDGESVAVTWVMEDYYHSDIVRVYRTADYESEGFSSEDDLLCRMKVRCTDERQDTFVTTVVEEGVFPEGICFTYHMEQ